MVSILPATAENIDSLRTDLLAALQVVRDGTRNVAGVRAIGTKYAEAIADLLSGAVGTADAPAVIDRVLPKIEHVYAGWHDVDAAFRGTVASAYAGAISFENLLLDQTWADLRDRAGSPLAETYTEFRSKWCFHLQDRPWDAFKNDAPAHIDSLRLDGALTALVRGDELDVEDALNDLTGTLRYAFTDLLWTQPDCVTDFEAGIWKRPEIVVSRDYWGSHRDRRLTDLLKKRGSSRFSAAFSRIDALFDTTGKGGTTDRRSAVETAISETPAVQRGRFFRCLLLHPDYEIRRFAAANTSLSSLWKVLTADQAPCGTILTLLETLVGSNRYTTAQRKVFFDAIYRRLLCVTRRSDVLYARGIVRILCRMNFLLEDAYFDRFNRLVDYLEAKERMFKIDNTVMRQYSDVLKRQKDTAGSIESAPPDFADVPLVILRKLARDGLFWDNFAAHPIVKIAKETIPYINSQDRALRLAQNHGTNSEVLRAVGKRRSLFSPLQTKLALLSNPHTPPGVSFEYLSDLRRTDVEHLLRRPGLHPELRARLRTTYQNPRQ